MKKSIFFPIFMIIFCSPVIPPSYAVDTPDKVIQSTERSGELILENIEINKSNYGTSFEGKLLNNSKKNWASISLELILYDKDSNLIKNKDGLFILNTGIVLPGENNFFGYISGNITAARKFELKFLKGDYLAHYNIALVKPIENKDLIFEDENIKIHFDISKKELSFVLANKTETPIEINWDKVSYVDFNKTSKKIIHSGVKFSEREKTQTESVIPPLSNLEDIIIPSDNIYYSERTKNWEKELIFPYGLELGSNLIGKNFSIFLPLKIDEKVKNYFFTFKVENVNSLGQDITPQGKKEEIKPNISTDELEVSSEQAIDIKIKKKRLEKLN